MTASESFSHRCSRPAFKQMVEQVDAVPGPFSKALTDEMDMEKHQKPENHVKTLRR